MSMSASQWGSPLASRRALLIHGLTSSLHTWESFAQLLVAEGFFVIAPNLLGHAGRRSSDYRLSTLAEDLQPYFVKDTYDVIIGHSLGGTVALSLLPFLPKEKETTVILVDPPLEVPVMRSDIDKHWILEELTAKTVEERMAENPAWSRVGCVLRTLAVSMCDRTTVESIFAHNKPWSFSGLFKSIPHNVKITVLVADPKLCLVCHLDHIPRDIERLEAIGLTGVGHDIPFQRPDAIMDVISLPRAEV
ncbi:alpha/beta-hydrolase [Rhizopogon vinicolor AM-OR11-026]|uniref:Alpha/beta-hydrolase n=1 Tax=Rhizopogon vinicolor AM-OR11-026 TaxID=1314800 RepID=A0A1B7NE94_9AGAM|nr:alpha/beta-hydrolase [Rhizopogon vinicolor AM-OR11-026]